MGEAELERGRNRSVQYEVCGVWGRGAGMEEAEESISSHLLRRQQLGHGGARRTRRGGEASFYRPDRLLNQRGLVMAEVTPEIKEAS